MNGVLQAYFIGLLMIFLILLVLASLKVIPFLKAVFGIEG